MDCLMAHTILHEDPFLEEFIVSLNQRLTKAMKKSIPANDIISPFQVSNLIFRTICMVAKYPTYTLAGDDVNQRALLKAADDRLRELIKASNDSLIGKSVAAAATVAQERIVELRTDMKSKQAYVDLMDALKTLFFTVSTKNGIVGQRNGAPLVFDTFVCCDACSCNGRNIGLNRHTQLLRSLEVFKIIDIVTIAAVIECDVRLSNVALELNESHISFLDDASDGNCRHVHNGILFFCRNALFRNLNLLRELSQLSAGDPSGNGVSWMDSFVTTLLWVKKQIEPIRGIDALVPVIDEALATAEQAYQRLGLSQCKQDLLTLDKKTREVFRGLSAPEYHLAVHSRDVFVGKPSEMKCANVKCTGAVKELLKCSGCDVTYYCSPTCQKSDWERHKNFCHEIESRQSKAKPLEYI
ncbi:hypothetical protein AGDE_01220 [Angomonas deanei]|nr:hypothetical protein AGDE_01220 [Angomonas deanei]|eukprot:EPY42703.1 hypothetical protein AGDE_01220 [Angomonas deanei]